VLHPAPVRILRAGEPEADARIEALCRRGVAADPTVAERVRAILADVRARGDAAVRELTQRFEGRDPAPIELGRADVAALAERTAPAVRASLEHAAARIRAFHERQREVGFSYAEDGCRLGVRVTPLARVAVYAPGGTARYPSSVLMTAVPAVVAGVREIVLFTPGPAPETMCAAQIAGVHRVMQVGGAQAIGAAAFGTESVPRVDKIVGPGSAYVAEAKRQVFGDVAIDAVAGPSEVLLVADDSARADVLAADLLAQAEHGADSFAVLITTDAALAEAVGRELAAQLAELPRRELAARALADHGALVVVRDLDAALALADRFAPEHLGLHVRDAGAAAARISNAGAIFVGPHSPEAAGDYLAGPNHVLPTAGTARFASPLGVWDFVKRTSLIDYDEAALCAQADDITRLARAEGLEAHARSIDVRMRGRKGS